MNPSRQPALKPRQPGGRRVRCPARIAYGLADVARGETGTVYGRAGIARGESGGACGWTGIARRQAGIALLEAMLAIVILGIGLLGTVGMQARAYSALSDAGMRAEATLASEKLLGVMTADVANIAQYNLAESGSPGARLAPWVNETKAAIPGAVLAVTVADQPAANRYQVDVSIRWQRKARSEANRHRVTSYIAR